MKKKPRKLIGPKRVTKAMPQMAQDAVALKSGKRWAKQLVQLLRKSEKSLLTSVTYPEGYDDDGKRMLARSEMGELTLFELAPTLGGGTFVELSQKVELAYWKAVYRIKGDLHHEEWGKATRERVKWARAIEYLVRFVKNGKAAGSIPVARRLADTLGEAIASCLEAEDPEACARKVASKVQDAVLAQLRAANLLHSSNMKTDAHRVALLINFAKRSLQYDQRIPKQSVLRRELDHLGWGVSRKSKDHKAKWRETFLAAGLENLPE